MTKVFTYNFPTAAQAPNPLNLIPFTNQSYLTMTQYSPNAALTQAFQMWSNVVDVSYQAGSSASNNLSFANWNVTTNGSGTTYGVGGNFNAASNFWIFLNKNYEVIDPNGPADNMISNPTVQNWGVWNLAHELGHTLLGDGHPNATNDFRMSIMAYPISVNNLLGNLGNNIIFPSSTVKIPLTPGMTDISFLQNGVTNPLNGKVIAPLGVSHASDGADTYSFTNTSINFTASTATATQGGPLSVAGSPGNYVMTIWDSAGTDTISAAGVTTNTYINLNGGQFSSIGSNKNIAPTGAIGSVGYGVEYNVGIAIGALIENATSGTAADTIVGNAAANLLAGGKGSDTVTGGAGGDYFKFDAFNPNISVQSGIGFTLKAADTDVITDFNKVQGDKIDLSFLDANTKIAGDQAFSYIGSAAFSNGLGLGVPGQLHIEKGGFFNTQLTEFVSGDVNGDLIADFRIQLVGFNMSTLTASDFIL